MWEPILWTDLKKPSGSILARLSDLRVVQFWDHDHLVAQALREALATAGGKGTDCDRSSAQILWDDVAVYLPGPRWVERQPLTDYFDGPVYLVIPKVKEVLERHVTSGSL